VRTPAQAVANALIAVRGSYYYGTGMCDHVVATYYGLGYSGFYTALQHAQQTPQKYRHGWSDTPPAGAPVFWSNSTAGHAALSVGRGNIATTDLVRSGRVNIVPIGAIQQHWGLAPLFWTDAWYGSQGVELVSPGLVATPAPTPKPPAPSQEEDAMIVQFGPNETYLLSGNRACPIGAVTAADLRASGVRSAGWASVDKPAFVLAFVA
jgi:hypothetical protein